MRRGCKGPYLALASYIYIQGYINICSLLGIYFAIRIKSNDDGSGVGV